jgi:D-sedoheptulose 7-phosphate isomerase
MKKSTQTMMDDFFTRNPSLESIKSQLAEAITLLTKTANDGGKILVCGNGGSAADSEHIAGEFLKSFVHKRPVTKQFRDNLCKNYGGDGHFIADNLQRGIKCIPLTSFCAYNTAFLNDCNGDLLYAQLVNALGVADDVLLAISTSGNAKNINYAAKVAKTLGIKVIALTGSTGGKLANNCDILLNVPNDITYQIQELHLPVYHLLCLAVENECFGD